MAKYISKPTVIDAIQYTGGRANAAEIREWMQAALPEDESGPKLGLFVTKGGDHVQGWNYIREGQDWGNDIVAAVYDFIHQTWVGLRKDDWIVRGTKGEHYPCDPDVFAEKYTRYMEEGDH